MLKQLIQRLLDSRTTPAQAAHNAAPGSGDIGINGTEYICPSDGYITALSNGAAAGGFNIALKRNGLNVQGGPQEIQFAEWTQARMIPVAKGDKVTLELYNQNIWEWRFIPAIGRGYKLLVRRALSCLKPSFNYLPRSSLRANPNGSAVRHTLQGGLRSQPASPNMSLQRMGMLGSTKIKRPRAIASTFILTGLMGTSSQEKLWHSRITLMPLLSRASFLLRRATGLLFPVRSMRYGSRQRWEANSNLSTGGALC